MAQSQVVEAYLRARQRQDENARYREERELEQKRYDEGKKRQDELDKRAKETFDLNQKKIALEFDELQRNIPLKHAEMYTKEGILPPGYNEIGTEKVEVVPGKFVTRKVFQHNLDPANNPLFKAMAPEDSMLSEAYKEEYKTNLAIDKALQVQEQKAADAKALEDTKAKNLATRQSDLLDQKAAIDTEKEKIKHKNSLEAIRLKEGLATDRAVKVANIRTAYSSGNIKLSAADNKRMDHLNTIERQAKELKSILDSNGWGYFQGISGAGSDVMAWLRGGETNSVDAAIRGKLAQIFTEISNAHVGSAITGVEKSLMEGFISSMAHRQTPEQARNNLDELLNEIPLMRDDTLLRSTKNKPSEAAKPKAEISPSGR